MKKSILLVLCLLLAGCGFHPQDKAILPATLQTLYVSGYSSGSMLYHLVTTQLRARGATLLTAPDPHYPTLTLGTIDSETKVASVDARNQAAEYLQQYKVSYQLHRPHEKDIQKELVFNRGFFNQTSLALGASREAELLKYEMERQAAERILWTLSQLVP